MKGYKERIQYASTLEEAKSLLDEAKKKLPKKAVERCQRVYLRRSTKKDGA